MNPGIIAGIVVAILASTASSKQQPQTPLSAGALIAIIVWTVLGPAFALALTRLLDALGRGDWGGAAIALGWSLTMAVVLFPWAFARAVLIPSGQVELAWAVTRLSAWHWRADVRGGAVIAASWAALRRAQRRGHEPAKLAWIERRRDAKAFGQTRWRLGGAGLVATGLLAEARGEREASRRLLASALELAEPTRPTAAVELASAWLCAEAMERGAWREAEFFARTAPVASRRLRWYGAVAGRITGIAPLASDLGLSWRWLWAPHRLAHLPLLRRAWATSASPQTHPGKRRPAAQANADGDPLGHALTLHARVLASPARLDRDTVATLGQAWDRALADPAVERALLERGRALGVHERAPGVDELATLVRADLLALVRAAKLELGGLVETSEVLAAAARQLHGTLLDELELTASNLEARVRGDRELPAIDEWQTFLAVREAYAEAVALGGLELRRLAFQEVHGPVCALAVWLWNRRGERAIGNAMFHWLLAEAIIVDDAEAIRLQERNVDCGV